MHHGKKAPTQRQLRVGELLRKALSEAFMRGEVYGPDGNSISVTVSEVRIAPDLRNATAYILPLGGKDQEAVLEKINGMAQELRSIITKKVHLKYSPALVFKLDTSFEQASRLDQLLHDNATTQDLQPETQE